MNPPVDRENGRIHTNLLRSNLGLGRLADLVGLLVGGRLGRCFVPILTPFYGIDLDPTLGVEV